MKKKKLIPALIMGAILVPASIGFTGCSCSDGDNATLRARDAYAISALSSISYLSEEGDNLSSARLSSVRNTLATPATARPTTLEENDVNGVYNCLTLFDRIVKNGGVDQSIENNTSTDANLQKYNFVMDISMPNGSGNTTVCKMFFDELSSTTKVEYDDFEEEIEESTTFAGVIVYGDEKFVVEGEREVEKEGKEIEHSIEFRTYKNSSATGIEADRNNYVKVEQSYEEGETEYEYTFFKNGNPIQDIELEYEEERKGIEIEFQLKDISTGVRKDTVFRIFKGNNANTFTVRFTKNGNTDNITVTPETNGSYTFTYSNGYEETLPLAQA